MWSHIPFSSLLCSCSHLLQGVIFVFSTARRGWYMDQEACQATNPLPVLAPPPVALLCSASFFQRCSGTPFLKGHSCPFFKGNLLKKQNQRFVAKGFEPKAAAWAWFLCVWPWTCYQKPLQTNMATYTSPNKPKHVDTNPLYT